MTVYVLTKLSDRTGCNVLMCVFVASTSTKTPPCCVCPVTEELCTSLLSKTRRKTNNQGL